MKKLLIASLLAGSTTVAFAAPFVVQDIRVDGATPETQQRIIAQLPVKVGQRATDSDMSTIVRKLFAQNSYDDVQVSRDGNTLVVKVMEKPVISDIEITGNSAVPTEALKENLTSNGLGVGSTLNRAKLEAFRQGLLEHYKTTGHYNATVDTELENVDGNQAKLKLVIKEEDSADLESITFNGNTVFDSDDLKDEMELSENAWWKLWGYRFSQQEFDKDLQALTDYYANRGYPKFRITGTDVKLSDDKTKADVTINVSEGALYTVKQARIVGNTAGMGEQLAPLLQAINLGAPFDGADVKAVEANIKSVLGNRGYAMAQVQIAPEFDDVNHTVNITYVVDAGRRYTVRQIRFEGNDVSADSTLRQEMRQQEGTWLSSNLIELGKIRLDRTGFYESVETRNEVVQGTDDQLDVIYKVKERNTGSINLGIGYGTDSGLSYQASIKQDNFLGKGSTISLGGSRNDYGTSVNLGYTEPYFTKDGVSLGGNIFYETYDNSDNDTTASYKRKTYGINATLGFPVNENNSFYLGLGYTHNKLSNIYPEYNRMLYLSSMDFNEWKFKADDFDFSFGWNYNSLNRGYFPTSGTKANIGARVTIPGSDNKYYKLSAEAQTYYPLTRDQDWVLSGKVSAAYANGYGGKVLPFYQTYSAGGIGSLRGFASGGIGPHAIYMSSKNYSSGNCVGVNTNTACYDTPDDDVVGGNAMTTASMELIVPTPFVADKNQINVRTSIFVDAASVWNTKWNKSTYSSLPDYSDPSRVRASVGVGFQWQSPIGPLVFSYAKPIKKYEGDDIEQFQFSIGGTF
ncbi:Beta-barrel assembly machine subunit BamA [Cricetibacter osteomyelitidis]|uniref:Outer membrane protein assembly factor BamA n=1 Tax=Cricetibacter osteomyelitidis TaxID=1521931 RepID=A0A4R2TCY3_9PAST|nr:outer membrane protein assembly factor BamA [Cricetibacter osteomyelitidis]TCP94968.1 Beta-barrel assembly machine subunit BamA [Cricetibacter osteomyelitidis]